MSTGPLPTSRDLRWAKRAKELEFAQLDGVRVTAEKWRGGLTAFTALLATVLAVGAPNLAENLSNGIRYWVGALMFLALASLAYGSWRAMNAAFGIPETILNNGEQLRKWTNTATKSAVSDLRHARNATCLGLVSLASAAGVAYLGPRPDHIGVVTTRQDQRLCGEIATSPDGTQLWVKEIEGSQTIVLIANVETINLAAEC